MTSGGEVQQIFNCRAALRLGFPMLFLSLFSFSLFWFCFDAVCVVFMCTIINHLAATGLACIVVGRAYILNNFTFVFYAFCFVF